MRRPAALGGVPCTAAELAERVAHVRWYDSPYHYVKKTGEKTEGKCRAYVSNDS